MNLSRLLSAIVGGSVRRPRIVLAVAIVLGLGATGLALRLRPTAATSTFVSSSSSPYRATQQFYRSFGEEPVAVLVKGDLQQLVLSSDIDRLAGLEGCLSGNAPASASATALTGGPQSPCAQLARAKTVKVVLGPGTFLNEAATQSDELLATDTRRAAAEAKRAQAVVAKTALKSGRSAAEARFLGQQASKITSARYQEALAKLALEYGLTSAPSIDNQNFVSAVVFDSSKPAGTPKQRFAYLFPSRDSALVSVRMKSGLSEAQRNRTIALIRQAVAMPQWHLQHGESYVVTGEPVIVSDLTSSITHSIELLLIAVLLVMAATLALVFTGRPRLLPLALALLAAALTFGALSAVGAPLTMASIAVLPVIVGLAVDYAIQFQSRVGETLDQAAEGAAGPLPAGGERNAQIRRAAALGAPTIATAAAASAAAMLVLALSPVPMVREFGVLLVLGVAIALLCALSAGAAVLALVSPAQASTLGERVPGSLRSSWRGARELLVDNPLTRLVSGLALGGAVRRPARVLCVGLALAALGWGLDTQTRVETDITKLVPQNLSSLRALSTLERATGVGGEIDLMLSGRNLATPATLEWMSRYQSAVLARFGYSEARGCARARLCPAFSLPDLFAGRGSAGAAGTSGATGTSGTGAAGTSGTGAAGTSGTGAAGTGAAARTKLSQRDVSGLLAVIPPYFSQDVITPDRRVATLAFGLRLMGLAQQHQLVEAMRSSLHPPKGVHAQLVGLSVLAAQSGAQVADPWRRLLTLLVGLAAVAIVLALAFRGDRRRVLAPLAPVVLATGWSALILFLVRVPLNPMSVTLGALVIAISTEFSVLLSERHRQERIAGHDTIEALRRSYRRTGAAVAASGVTAIAGFGVLTLSDIRMLRDFGLVTLIDLSVSLIGVLIALPAAIVIAERDQPLRLRGRAGELGGGGLRRIRSVSARGAGRSAAGAAKSPHEPA